MLVALGEGSSWIVTGNMSSSGTLKKCINYYQR